MRFKGEFAQYLQTFVFCLYFDTSYKLVSMSGKSEAGRRKGSLGAVLAIVVLGTLCTGCGSDGGLHVVPVEGSVTYNGQPLNAGGMLFLPVQPGKGRPAKAKINADGTFVVVTTKNNVGLMPGEYKISINSLIVPLFKMSPREASKAARENLRIPSRYADSETSGLTVTVAEDDRAKTLDLVLED